MEYSRVFWIMMLALGEFLNPSLVARDSRIFLVFSNIPSGLSAY